MLCSRYLRALFSAEAERERERLLSGALSEPRAEREKQQRVFSAEPVQVRCRAVFEAVSALQAEPQVLIQPERVAAEEQDLPLWVAAWAVQVSELQAETREKAVFSEHSSAELQAAEELLCLYTDSA